MLTALGGALVGGAVALVVGIRWGRGLMWRQMFNVRPFGLACLERLGRHYGAKIEISEM